MPELALPASPVKTGLVELTDAVGAIITGSDATGEVGTDGASLLAGRTAAELLAGERVMIGAEGLMIVEMTTWLVIDPMTLDEIVMTEWIGGRVTGTVGVLTTTVTAVTVVELEVRMDVVVFVTGIGG
jgi:hypothetical protein